MTYPGGKGRMFQRIISMIPPHGTYIETHLGGGAVMRAKKPAKRSIGIEIDSDVVAGWNGRPDVEVICADAVDFLESFQFTGDEFVYCDPPYLASTRRQRKIYRHEYTTADHRRLLEVLKRLPCPVMLSGYPSALYDAQLPDWHCDRSLQRTQADVAIECIWTNFEPPAVLHDHNHVGENFRQREAIRRKRGRMVARIRALPIQERGALVAELAGLEPELFAAAMEALR